MKKKTLCLLLFASVFTAAASAQDFPSQYAATITASDLKAHLSFLASDELEGRETAERGQKIAAKYIASWFQRVGLQPIVKTDSGMSWFQSFPLMSAEIRDADLTLNGKTTWKLIDDFIVLDKAILGKDLDLELAFAGYGIADTKYNNLSGLDLKGKAVVILSGEPRDAGGTFLITGTKEPSEWGGDPALKIDALRKAGAATIVVITPEIAFNSIKANPMLRHFMLDPSLELAEENMQDPLGMFLVSTGISGTMLKAARTTEEKLRAQYNTSAKVTPLVFKGLRFQVKADADVKIVYAENVLGFLEGTDKKDEVIVLTAHYDHLGIENGIIHNGADDDGTGTSSVLEMAEAFMQAVKEGHRPRRSILFMPVSGEEKGLLGSSWYSDHPVIPLENTVCDLNIDMIGRIDKQHPGNDHYVYIIGADKLSSDLQAISDATNTKYSKLELDYTYNKPDDPNRFYYRSDHYNFAKHNIPVIFYFTGVHEDYHKPTDDVWKIDFNKTANIAQLVFHTAWEIANRDQRLVVDRASDMPNNR